jgi:MGT family glycosyltransferase
MSKALFFGLPLHGHTNPSLGLVKELVARGERVIYYSFPEFREKILATGAEYRESPEADLVRDLELIAARLSYVYLAVIKAAANNTGTCVDIIKTEKPDYIIHDSIAAWGKYAAIATNTPSVASISTFLFSRATINPLGFLSILSKVRPVDLHAFNTARISARFLLEKYGIKETGLLEVLNNTSPLNIIYTIRELQPHGDSFDPARFTFVGPSISSRPAEADEPDYQALRKPLVYISFGTLLHNQAEFYRKAFVAFRGFEGTIVLSAGNSTDITALGDIPENFVVRNRVNQIEVLKYAIVFVTHGGMNSAHEALYSGVPLILIPFQEEQRTVARQCAKIGCGIYIDKLDASKVTEAVKRVRGDSSFTTSARELSKLLRESSGAKGAVDAIFGYMKAINISGSLSYQTSKYTPNNRL